LSLIEKQCFSSGQKSMLENGARIGICQRAKLSLSTSAAGWPEGGTVLTVVNPNGGGERLTKPRSCLRSLDLHPHFGGYSNDRSTLARNRLAAFRGPPPLMLGVNGA